MKIKEITKQAIVCAVYVALTVALEPISYGAIQVRVSDALCLLVAYNPKYLWGITLGVAIANMASPLGVIDVVFGAGATFVFLGIAILINKKVKSLPLKKLVVMVFSTLQMSVIAVELNMVYDTPLLYTFGVIAVGEFISQVIGYILFSVLERKIDF